MKRRKILTYLLSLTLMMTSMPTQFFAAQVDAQSNEPYIDLEQQTTTESVIKVGQPQEYSGDGFNVRFEVTEQWAGAFNASMTISNTSESALENWTLSFEFEHEITNIWGAQIVSHEGTTYVIKNATYNQDIAVGESVTVGFSANWIDEINVPSSYDMLIQEEQVAAEDYTIDFKVTNDWGSAFNGEISITNNTEEDIEDWILEFDFNREITSFWTASIEEHEGDHYVVKNAGYNANIKAGETLTLGFAGTPGDVNNEPENYKLTQIGQEIDYEKDTDEDGIPDYFEKILGTNPNNTDSDGDGLPDGYEYNYLGTNPLIKDTDNNCIDDSNEDFDMDQLDNYTEYLLDTDPFKADSDYDKINDYDEVKIYNTNPLVDDTDEDTLLDGDEIILELNPLCKDTDGDGILDPDERINQTVTKLIGEGNDGALKKVSVNFDCSGMIENEVDINNMYHIDVLSSDVVGLVGVPIEIQTFQEFDKATITFEYDENKLDNIDESNLSLMWYDEENDMYQILDKDSIIDTENNTVTYITTHFSTYLLVDRQKWYDAWKYDIDYTRTEASKLLFDIGLIIDVSGSMYGTNLRNTKLGLKGFVENMYDGDDACLITFDSRAYLVNDFGSTKNQLIKGIESLVDLGGTSVYAGLNLGISKLINKTSPNSKIAILVCDGDVNNVDSLIDKAKQEEIKIYTINIGYAASHSYLEKIANETGGTYYYATTAEQLTDILMAIQCQTITGIDTTDTDGDGLYDVFETKGVRISNGTIVKSNPLLIDTDGDNLLDSEEIIYEGEFKKCACSQYKDINEVEEGIEVTSHGSYLTLLSYPDKVDSDGDSYCDGYLESDTKTYIIKTKALSKVKQTEDLNRLKYDVIRGLPELNSLAARYCKENKKSLFDKQLLVLQFMRHLGYDSLAWDATAGKIDENFVNYVLYNDKKGIAKYFTSGWYFYDPKTKVKIDGAHLAATLNAYCMRQNVQDRKDHKSTFSNLSIMNQAGWVGDLHTFMVLRIRKEKGNTSSPILMYLPDCKTYKDAYKNTYNFLGHENSSMPMDDVYADVDAVGLAEILKSKGTDVYTAVGNYYVDECSRWSDRRFYNFVCLTTIQHNIGLANGEKEGFRKVVDFYTQKVNGEEWMLIDKNKLPDAILSKEVRQGIRDGFVDFIFKNMKA